LVAGVDVTGRDRQLVYRAPLIGIAFVGEYCVDLLACGPVAGCERLPIEGDAAARRWRRPAEQAQ